MSWDKAKLKDCTEYITDGDHQPVPKSNKGVYFIKIKDIVENKVIFDESIYAPVEYYDSLKADHRVQYGDVLYTVVGSYGIPSYIDTYERFCFERNIALLHPNEKVDSRFLYYALKNPDFNKKAQAIANGSAQKLIPLCKLKQMEIPLPNIEIQRWITSILSAYDDLIENNQKQIKLLEEAAQLLYKEWFVDLRFPGYEHIPIVDGMPEGWKRTTVDAICESVGGGTPSTKNEEYYREGTIRWVTPTDITRKSSLVLLEPEKRITEEGLNNCSAKMLPPYTILMTSRASVGYFGLCEHEVCTNQGFISCIPRKNIVRFYLLYNLMSRVDEIRSKASGSTFLEISKKTFRELIILLPNNDVLEGFNSLIVPIITQIEKLTKSMEHLKEARDRLLPKLMNGEVEV